VRSAHGNYLETPSKNPCKIKGRRFIHPGAQRPWQLILHAVVGRAGRRREAEQTALAHGDGLRRARTARLLPRRLHRGDPDRARYRRATLTRRIKFKWAKSGLIWKDFIERI